MITSLYTLHLQKKFHIHRVCSLLSISSIFVVKHYSFTTISLQKPISSGQQSEITHINTSFTTFSGIANSVLSTCSHLFEKKKELGRANTSLRDLLLNISDISPETTRRFRRVSELKPDDVLELLLGFQFCCEKPAIEARKVETLWEIFKWASNQNRDFKHFHKSCEIMASILTRVGLFREVEFLLSTIENQGILLDSHEIFSNLIEGYVNNLQLERAISVYTRLRERNLVPSLLCYRVLLNLLIEQNEALLAFQVCMDMGEMGFELSDAEKGIFDNVISLLCKDGKIQEARNLVKKGMNFGLEPSNVVLNEIASGFCEKKDFEDVLKFFTEVRRPPDVLAGNKFIFSLCSNFGTDQADLFLQELEHLGFSPDEITLGILVCWSCREGKLRNAFLYLSDILSRGLKPDVCSYNAIISGLFKEGVWRHAKDVFLEMIDMGILPNMSTFKVLLAGYVRARQFDEAKVMVHEMAKYGFIELSFLEDPLSKAFMVLGLSPLAVRVKRDNHVGFVSTEFFDSLGNGLYLDTDVDEYEKTVEAVLNNSMIPNFDSLVRKECDTGNLKVSLVMVEEMVRWGQELSLSTLSALVKSLCASRCHVKAITTLLEKVSKAANELDQEILNLLVQAYSKKRYTYLARKTIEGMLQRQLKVKNEAYTALLKGVGKKGDLKDFRSCWDLARKGNWLPGLVDCKVLVGCLCEKNLLKEALELLESMLACYPHLTSDVCNVFLEQLCNTGYTSVAHVLLEQVRKQGCILDHRVYSHIIRGFIREKEVLQAFRVFDFMCAENLAPSLDVSVLLIPQLCRADRIKQALYLKDIFLGEDPSSSLSVYSAILGGFCKAGEVGEAFNQFQDMLSKGRPDFEIYNMLVQGYCLARKLKKVAEFLGFMIRNNARLSISSYRKVVQLMCEKGRIVMAFSVKELMLRESDSAYLIIYNILIFYLFRMGKSLHVNSLIDELQQKGLSLDEVTYNFLVHGSCQRRDVSSSLHYLTTMISKQLRPSARSLRGVISCLSDAGEVEKLLQLSREMELRGWVNGSTVQNATAEGLLCQGRFQEAENYLDRMADKGLIPDSINYDKLIKQFCWYGRLNKAVDLLNIMLMKGSTPNSSTYDSLICGFCSCNKLDRAMDFHREMLDKYFKPSIKTWDVLVGSFCNAGQTAEAEKLLISMVDIGETPTREIYRSVINRYSSENNLRKASELLQAMQQFGYDPDFETHWSLVSNLSSSYENNDSGNQGFLSRLLSKSGFLGKQDSKAKLG